MNNYRYSIDKSVFTIYILLVILLYSNSYSKGFFFLLDISLLLLLMLFMGPSFVLTAGINLFFLTVALIVFL